VHRWITRGTQANGATWELHQTYDGRTLAPLKWSLRSSAGADSRFRIDGGNRVRDRPLGLADDVVSQV
jgi:hypothetical protein